MSKKQKFSLHGKQILLLGLVALVITAGYYRWTVESENFAAVPVSDDTVPANAEQGGEGDNAQSNQNTENTQTQSVAQLRQERDQNRGESIEQWNKTLQSNDSSQEMKKEAEAKIKQANECAEKEKSIETLVKAKGFTDCFVHINENGVSLMVSGGEINGAKVAQMKDIILSQTEVAVRNIKISADSY